MKESKRKRLEQAGWAVGSTGEFLGLTDEEVAFVEVKLVLAENLRKRRLERGLTQVELSRQLGSSQSRVAKMEAGDRSVSLDLLVRSLLAIGATRRDLAKMIEVSAKRRAA